MESSASKQKIIGKQQEHKDLRLTLEGITLGNNDEDFGQTLSPKRNESVNRSFSKHSRSRYSKVHPHQGEIGNLFTPRENVKNTPRRSEYMPQQRPPKPTFLPALDISRLSQASPSKGAIRNEEITSSNDNSPKTPRLVGDALAEKRHDLRKSLGPKSSWNTPRNGSRCSGLKCVENGMVIDKHPKPGPLLKKRRAKTGYVNQLSVQTVEDKRLDKMTGWGKEDRCNSVSQSKVYYKDKPTNKDMDRRTAYQSDSQEFRSSLKHFATTHKTGTKTFRTQDILNLNMHPKV